MKSILMYIVGRMPDSELVIKTINASGESFSVLCGFRTASKKEILKSYRKLAVKWHPDQYKGDDKKKAEKMFIDVAAAKEVLTDPGKLNSLVCTVCSFLRSFERFVCYSFGWLRRFYGRSVRRLSVRSVRSFVFTVGLKFACSVSWSVDRTIFGLVGRLVVIWFVRFHSMTIFVCLFIWFSVLFFVSSYSRRSVFVRL